MLLTSRNSGRKIMQIYQNIKWASRKNKEEEPVEPVKMNIYQSNTYRKDLWCLLFNDEPRVQERQQEEANSPYQFLPQMRAESRIININITDNTNKQVVNIQKGMYRTKNGAFKNSSISWIFLQRLLIQNHSKVSITDITNAGRSAVDQEDL